MENIIDDLKLIKRDYNEDLAHLCRELFPTILETPGLLYKLLSEHFARYKYLYDDIIRENKKQQFKGFIYNYYNLNVKEETKSYKSVHELLDEVGYVLYECDCFEKNNEYDKRVSVKQFEKYYAKGEELCTFKDPNRIDNHYIFFIVKKDVDKIRREDFDEPSREDLYSTSVLDLQFDKGNIQRVSIKSRYNHTVNNPDATYSNNLEMIAPGLTYAFEKEYGFKFDLDATLGFELNNYVKARDGKFYKYNFEEFNIHYCPNNIILCDGNVITTYSKDKSRFILMDGIVLDRQNKKMFNGINSKNSFPNVHKNIELTNIKKINNYTIVEIFMNNGSKAEIKIDRDNKIIGYTNNYIEEVGDYFLYNNIYTTDLNMLNLRKCGNYFLKTNRSINKFNLPKLEECGTDFLIYNRCLEDVFLPKLKICGNSFLLNNINLEKLYLPNLRECGTNFLANNKILNELNLPNLEIANTNFLCNCNGLNELSLPKLSKCGNSFLERNGAINTLYLPKLKKCGNWFMHFNRCLTEINLPELVLCGDGFLNSNCVISKVNMPKLELCNQGFLSYNLELTELSLPSLCGCDNNFLKNNRKLKKLYLPKLLWCGNSFLYQNKCLEKLLLLQLEKCGDWFLFENKIINNLYLPNLKQCGDYFLSHNQSLTNLDLPELAEHGKGFLQSNHNLLYLNLSNKKSFVKKHIRRKK